MRQPVDEWTTPLHAAVEAGDLAEVDRVLTSGFDVNAPDSDGATPLMRAVYTGNVDLVRRLLAAGADVTRTDGSGSSALSYVTGFHDTGSQSAEILDLLIDHGLSITADEASPVLQCARCPAIAKTLLRHGADPNRRDDWEETPLMGFAGAGMLEMVRVLIEAGADVDAQDQHLESPLMWAAARGHAEVVAELLRAGADPTSRNNAGGTALNWAVSSGSVETARLLLEAGAGQVTGLMLAIAFSGRNTPMLQLLLEYGPDLSAEDAEGRTPLMRARECKYYEGIRMLKAAGARR